MDNSKSSEIAKNTNPRKRQHDEVPTAESKKTRASTNPCPRTSANFNKASLDAFAFAFGPKPAGEPAPATCTPTFGFGLKSPAQPAFKGFGTPAAPATRSTATPPFAFGLKSAPATLGSQPAPVPAQPAFNPESFVDGFKAGFDAGLEAGLRAAAKLQAKPATSTYDHFAPQPATFYLGTPAASAFSTFNFGGPAKPAFGGGGFFGTTSTKPATSTSPFDFGLKPDPATLATTALAR